MKATYKFKIVKPIVDGKYTGLSGLRNAIFLAGPCPRKNFDADDWRFEAFDILDDLGFTGTVITPTNPDYGRYEKEAGIGHDAMRMKQVNWERVAMHAASAIVFWVPRDSEHPALTTNIEFGEWYKKPNVFAGWPDYAEHNGYFECKLKEQGKTFSKTLRETLQRAIDALNRPTTMYFTSDTHFKQQRTFEFSRRPFCDLTETDLEMISNWNKNVTCNDVVVHAGDFIDPEHINMLQSLLSSLNFGKLEWTLGNYDRKIKADIEKIVADYVAKTGRAIELHDKGDFQFDGPSGKHYAVVHEPVDFEYTFPEGTIVLYGHIHGRAFAKRNGFDLAIDYHHYTPISMEQVEWFANAMQYWDENVFSDKVRVKTT